MKPLKIAILWHFHQPYYKKDGEFILPWVRFHGIKDYFDVPELFHEFPSMKQTINIVPSLHKQLDEYVEGKTIDKIQRLSFKSPGELDDNEKAEIIRLFFQCNAENMIMPYNRYRELFEKASKPESAIKNFTDQDWLDLQVWYNLTWVGRFSRERNAIKRLFKKGRDFTEQEKHVLLSMHNEILAAIKPQLENLVKLGQLELSCSPMYHPILPLLCDSKSATEAMPDAIMPDPLFNFPQDARAQVDNAIDYVKKNTGITPRGMWPSEGSISDEALEIMAKTGIKWVASDEEVLFKTLKDNFHYTEKYFPRKFTTKSGNITILFRDHQLSDAIGFVYSRWNPWDAANDFCHKLRNIRNTLIDKYGDECLDHAVVPVILDGENCWEYYQDDGIHFRRELNRQLLEAKEFQTVTCSEAVAEGHINFRPALNHIRAGSWINANFKIWIGHSEDRAAWNMLGKARYTLEEAKNALSVDQYKNALDEVYAAEGSDWFWWYGDEHTTDNKKEFDELFRWHIENIYRITGREVPEEVYIPISELQEAVVVVQQTGEVHPIIDGILKDEKEWQNSGYYEAVASMSAMHQIGELLVRLWFASDNDFVYFRADTTHKLKNNEYIELQFISPAKFNLLIYKNRLEIKSDSELKLGSFKFAEEEIIEFAFSRKLFSNGSNDGDKRNIEMTIHTKSDDGELFYPRQGILELII